MNAPPLRDDTIDEDEQDFMRGARDFVSDENRAFNAVEWNLEIQRCPNLSSLRNYLQSEVCDATSLPVLSHLSRVLNEIIRFLPTVYENAFLQNGGTPRQLAAGADTSLKSGFESSPYRSYQLELLIIREHLESAIRKQEITLQKIVAGIGRLAGSLKNRFRQVFQPSH